MGREREGDRVKDLTFTGVSKINRERCALWHPGFPDDKDWTLADWSNAMCGEAGETANIVKKIRRYEFGLANNGDPTYAHLKVMLAKEIADTYLYLDLLASKARINIARAIILKFNEVSARQGFPQMLGEADFLGQEGYERFIRS